MEEAAVQYFYLSLSLSKINEKHTLKKQASNNVKCLKEFGEDETLRKIMKNTWFPANLNLYIQRILANGII